MEYGWGGLYNAGSAFLFKVELVPPTDSEILKCAPSYTNLVLRADTNASSSQPSVKVFCEEDAKGLY